MIPQSRTPISQYKRSMAAVPTALALMVAGAAGAGSSTGSMTTGQREISYVRNADRLGVSFNMEDQYGGDFTIEPPYRPFMPVMESSSGEILSSKDIKSTSETIFAIPAVLSHLGQITALPKTSLARLLGDVSRVSLNKWEKGSGIATRNEEYIREVHDVASRAFARFGDPNLVRGWLMTPQGVRAQKPIDLLAQGRVDEARFMVMSNLPSVAPLTLPQAFLTQPADEDTERVFRRHDFVMRSSDDNQSFDSGS